MAFVYSAVEFVLVVGAVLGVFVLRLLSVIAVVALFGGALGAASYLTARQCPPSTPGCHMVWLTKHQHMF